jgi:hypothetical protein
VDRNLLTAGNTLPFTVSAFDATGAPQLLPRDLQVTVIPGAGAGGPLPVVSAGQLTTSELTRGGYLLVVESASRGVVVEQAILVDPGFGGGELQEAYGNLSAQINAAEQAMLSLSEALRRNDLAQVAIAGARLRELRDELDLAALQVTPALAPETGFLPASMPGIPTSSDEAYMAGLDLLLGAVRESTEFLTQLRPGAARNDDTRAVAVNGRLRSQVDSMTRRSLSTFTAINRADELHQLMSVRVPQLILADLNLVVTQLESQGLLVQSLGADQFYRSYAVLSDDSNHAWHTEQPAFFSLVGVSSASAIRQKIIKDLYFGIVKDLIRKSQNLIAEGVLLAYTDSVAIPGIVTGASLSFHSFQSGHSIVEAFSAGQFASGHEVQVVGPELVAKIFDAIKGVKDVRFSSMKEAHKAVKTIKSAVAGVSAALKEQYKIVYPDQLMTGCVFIGAPNCQQLGFSAGLPVVHTSGGFPAPVLLIVHDTVGGNMSVGSFLFFPN